MIAHTRSNAYLFFQEKNLGTLEVGKLADLVVLDRDYMTVPAAEIKRIEPTMTMVGGRVVLPPLTLPRRRPILRRRARRGHRVLTYWDAHSGIASL